MRKTTVVFAFLLLAGTVFGQSQQIEKKLEELKQSDEYFYHRMDVLEKKIEDLLWYEKTGDVAYIDKVYMHGPPKWQQQNPDAQGAGNPVRILGATFLFPKPLIRIRNTL
ncbi:MAG: hypothetical protein U5L09_16140 [Bacteroidales bacterium]|nr:hypothetical protein [Bacteroidales bacterium]